MEKLRTCTQCAFVLSFMTCPQVSEANGYIHMGTRGQIARCLLPVVHRTPIRIDHPPPSPSFRSPFLLHPFLYQYGHHRRWVGVVLSGAPFRVVHTLKMEPKPHIKNRGQNLSPTLVKMVGHHITSWPLHLLGFNPHLRTVRCLCGPRWGLVKSRAVPSHTMGLSSP